MRRRHVVGTATANSRNASRRRTKHLDKKPAMKPMVAIESDREHDAADGGGDDQEEVQGPAAYEVDDQQEDVCEDGSVVR